MAYDPEAQAFQRFLDMATNRNLAALPQQQFFPIDGKTQADNAVQQGIAKENFAQEQADALSALTNAPQTAATPQTQALLNPQAAVTALQNQAAQANAQAQAEPANKTYDGLNPTPEQQAAQAQQKAQELDTSLLASAQDPLTQAFNAQYDTNVVAPKLNAALLPVREAQYAANDAAIQRAYPDTVMGIQRDLVRQLAAAKQQYDVSKAAGDENGMALAHQAADVVRQQAASIGLNLDQFGGNEDTAAMAQALANNDARAMQNLIGGDVPPEQYYQERYNAARQQGFSRRKAEGYAQAQTEKYQADRYARMQQAFFTYGLTDRGSINPFGVQLFGKMMQDNPETVGLYAKMFGLPIDDYKLGNQIQLLGEQNKNAIQQIGVKHDANMQEIGLKGQIQAMITELNGRIKSALAQQQFGYAQELQKQKLAAQAYLKSLGGGDASSSSSGTKSSGDGKPLSEAMQTKLLNARDLYEKEKGSLSNVQDTIDALDKIKGEISDDDARDAINAMEYALNARREAVSWNDHGESGGKQNFIDYYDAVANAGYPELVSDLSALYDRAKNG